MRLMVNLASVGVFLSLLFLQIFAQRPLGTLSGFVTDSRGRVVRGAHVFLLYVNRLKVGEETTDERGQFHFENLIPGDYSVAVVADGLTQSGGSQPVKVRAGTEFRITIALTVAAGNDAVVFSATRTDSLQGETPSGAYVIPGINLLRTQSISAADALRSSPGVTVIQQGRRGGQTSIFVRGGEADYTKVLVDGVPVNDPGGSFNFADLTTDNAARIELIRGTQSAIYGSDAMSGVLQVFTQPGITRKPELELSGEGGSFGYNRQFAHLSGEFGQFDYSLSSTHLRTDGRDLNDRYQNRIFTGNFGYRFNERRQFRVTARQDSAGMGVPGPTAILYPDPDESARRRHLSVGARIDDQTTSAWHQSLSFAYSEARSLSLDPVAQDLTMPGAPPAAGASLTDFAALFNNHQRRMGLRYQGDRVFFKRHFISMGVDYERERAVFDNGFSNVLHVDAERTDIGAFLQDQFKYGPRLFITAGVRVENSLAKLPIDFAWALRGLGSTPYSMKAGFNAEILPKVAGIYVLSLSGLQSRRGQTRLKFNYGEGIKAPQLVEMFGPDPLFALGNPALGPERSRTFDIGIEQYLLKDSIRIEGFYFDNRFRDQIAYVADPATMGGPIRLADGRLTNFINFDRTIARGFEAALFWRPTRWLEFGGNYTSLQTRLLAAADLFDQATNRLVPNPEVGLPLLRRPRNSGSFSAALNAQNFTLNLIGSLLGERRDRDPVTSSQWDRIGSPVYNQGYQKVDLAGSYSFTSWMNMFARVENLLNQDYQEVFGYPAYRLNFSAGMRFRIGGGR